MRKYIFPALFALIITAAFSASTVAQVSSHSVWTQNSGGRQVVDPDLPCDYTTFTKFRMVNSWTERTPGYDAQAHFRGAMVTGRFHPCGSHFYEFSLNQSTVTTIDSIEGTWDVYRDGTLMCSACNGEVHGLSQPAGVGNYYKLSVDDPLYGPGAWFYSGYINVREDF